MNLSASSEGADQPAQKRSLTRDFSVLIPKVHVDEGVGKIAPLDSLLCLF